MSFADRLVLWLHVGFAIFTIGPVTVAIMSTPRYIRQGNPQIVRYLSRLTVIFTFACLAVLVAGLFLAQLDKDFSRPWLTVSITLFVVAIALLVLIIRDQRRAIGALESSAAVAVGTALTTVDPDAGDQVAAPVTDPQAAESQAGPQPSAASAASAGAAHLASIERGRIATMGGVISLIWLIILVLMVWNS
jgi:asparagine N-glycosylation enzyme membrane subunit Stt3